MLAVIPGTDLADQYVIVGAHYDHLGTPAAPAMPATRSATAPPTTPPAWRPRSPSAARSPRSHAAAPLGDPRVLGPRGGRPARLAATTRSIRSCRSPTRSATSTSTSRAPTCCRACATPPSRSAPETGGARFQDIVQAAIGEQTLDTDDAQLDLRPGPQRLRRTSSACGVPTVFFTDATGPCYHTAQDEPGVVDFDKLEQQIATSLAVTRELARTTTRRVPGPRTRRSTLPGRGHVRERGRSRRLRPQPVLRAGPADDHEHQGPGPRRSVTTAPRISTRTT